MRATFFVGAALGPRIGYFSPSWLASLRFTSVDKHPIRGQRPLPHVIPLLERLLRRDHGLSHRS